MAEFGPKEIRPVSLYARTKIDSEGVLLALHNDRFAPVILRFGTVYGLSPRPRFDLVINPLGFLSSSGLGIDIGNLAHIFEYAGLAALLHRALAESDERQRTSGSPDPPDPPDPPATNNPGVTTASDWRLFGVGSSSFVPFALALAYAVFDELHQKLVPGRGFELANISTGLSLQLCSVQA